MQIGECKLKTAKETIEDFLAKLEDFTNETNTKFANFREEFLIIADLPEENLKKLTKEEMFDGAYLLYSYASYIQDQYNRQKIVYDLCTDQLEKMVAKNSEKFSTYTKHDAKIQLIIVENEYAKSIDNYRQVAHARIQSLEGKVYEIKRKADILLEKGKRS
jgi:hypothetical protein